MNKGELVNAVAAQAGLSKGDANRAVDITFQVITEALQRGDEVKLVGFGSFLVAQRAAGEARNPRTGEKVQVPAQRTPRFRAGAQLRSAVNSQ
ncbi:HU family DNA-binding protein [Enterovirga aerilata]|uniref:HU family DNA-binding protein n=1 Tax=Enterovirga aerilata TaxID=2730920 RepID=A0A849HWK1_9HYPH|nr:HU family DNA-binding protein [Enterovirga sp. DB1703]NNM71916.1 HU family DNA-binding protein [Enterovirga sp. DB1703]